MLHIYYIDDPTPLSENLYSEVLKNGEVRQRDFDDIFSHQLGKGTYTDHFTYLAKRLRLIEEIKDSRYYVLSDQTAGAIRQSNPSERLFDILTRLPHFARWVQLTQQNEIEEIDYADVVPSGARQYKMRQSRHEQFEKWAEMITEVGGERTFEEIQTEYERRSAYIWEDYISLDGNDFNLDPIVILVLMGAAAKCGASFRTNRLIDTLPIDRDEFNTIVEEVFNPVGVPLHHSDSCIGLGLTTELRVESISSVWEQVSEVVGEDIEVSALNDLTDHLQYETNLLDFVDTAGGVPLQFTVSEGTEDFDTRSKDASKDRTTDLTPTQSADSATFNAIPPTTSQQSSREFYTEIEKTLEAAIDNEERTYIHPQLEYHTREQWYHLGSIPLLKAPDFEELTSLGERYFNQDTATRRKLFFDHLLARNPSVRAIIGAVDLNHYKVEQTDEEWVIRTDNNEIPVDEVLDEISDRDELTIIGVDSPDRIQQIISYLGTAGILKGQGTVDQLQISASMHEHLKQNPRGGRQLLEEAKPQVQDIVEQLQ